MDALDFGLLAALARQPRASYEELGASVALSANAAKARLRRLESDGVLQGVLATPRPALLGLGEGLLLFSGVDDLDEREDDLLAGLAEVPGVRFADAAQDHTVWVWTLQRDEPDAERIERAAISLVGKPPARRILGAPMEPPRELAPADWRILRALQPDGRAPAKVLAARAGLTFKPLKRRLAALLARGDVRLQPVVSSSEASGHVLVRLTAFLAPGADAAPTPAPPDAVVTSEAPGVVQWLVLAPTLREGRARLRALQSAPGVERAHLVVATRRASFGWLEDALARRIEPAAPAPVPLPRAAR